jgi:parallel beta-helix repeat protein
MPKKEKKKSWKELQRERQKKQQRAQEAYQTQSEIAAKKKPRQWPKGKIFVAVFFLVLILAVYGAWQYTQTLTPSDGTSPVIPTTGVIYIRPDGQVSPSTAPISNVGNSYYTLTADVPVPLLIGRDNIVIDGANHALQGTWEYSSQGVDLTGRSNVTIKNLEIAGFDYGVYLSSASNNIISQNYFTDNYCAIWFEASSNDNLISGNNVEDNEMWAVFLKDSSNNKISENQFTLHTNYTIFVRHSNYTTFSGNYIADNWLGFFFVEASDNILYHNNFVNNYNSVSGSDSTNAFDNGEQGNYWSDYEEGYPDAEELAGSGVWNMPYVIDEYNQDNYPLVNPWSS